MATPPVPEDEGLPPDFPPNDERNWAVFCHLGGMGGYVLPAFGNIAVPLVLWLLRRNESVYVDHHGREAVNFQISITLYAAVSALLTLVLIGFALLPAVLIFHFVWMIVASVSASQGERYRYPFTLRLVS